MAHCKDCGGEVQGRFCGDCGKRQYGVDHVGTGRYILSFLMGGLLGLALQFFLRYRGWLAFWILLAFWVVVIVLAAIGGSFEEDCYYNAYGNYVCN